MGSEEKSKNISFEWRASRGDKWNLNLSKMEAMLEPTNDPLIDCMKCQSEVRIADVGCGGGASSFAILNSALKGSFVHGFDLSRVLVETAKSKASLEENIVFSCQDVSTGEPPELFDHLVSRFGVMFFDAPPVAFRNLSRWLKPGGSFAFSIWGPLEENQWVAKAHRVVGEYVDLPKKAIDAPGPFRYANPAKFLNLLRDCGFKEVASSTWRGHLAVGGGLSPRGAAHFAMEAFAVCERLSEVSKEKRGEALQKMERRYSEHVQGGRVLEKASIHLVFGRV